MFLKRPYQVPIGLNTALTLFKGRHPESTEINVTMSNQEPPRTPTLRGPDPLGLFSESPVKSSRPEQGGSVSPNFAAEADSDAYRPEKKKRHKPAVRQPIPASMPVEGSDDSFGPEAEPDPGASASGDTSVVAAEGGSPVAQRAPSAVAEVEIHSDAFLRVNKHATDDAGGAAGTGAGDDAADDAGGADDAGDAADAALVLAERSYVFERRLADAAALRAVGNRHFGAGRFGLALGCYQRAEHHAAFDESQM